MFDNQQIGNTPQITVKAHMPVNESFGKFLALLLKVLVLIMCGT